jgi:hypothetical protein
VYPRSPEMQRRGMMLHDESVETVITNIEIAQHKLDATREYLRWAVARRDNELVERLRHESYGRWVELERLRQS